MSTAATLMALHFVGDFLLQSDWMATNKSKRWDALALHVLLYSICFMWFGMVFFAITFATHFVTDAITSRITSRLWFMPKVGSGMKDNWIQVEVKDTRHWFFVMIGFDQLIHACTLFATAYYFL